MKKTTFIYALVDPTDLSIKYIGKTDYVKKRFFSHLREKTKTKKANWIKSLRKKGLEPQLEIIDEVLESEWQFWEKHYISLYKSWGFDLKNGTNGGEGGATCIPWNKGTRGLIKPNKGSFKKGRASWNKGLKKETNLSLFKGSLKKKNKVYNGVGVLQYTLDGELLKRWKTIKEVSRFLGISIYKVSKKHRSPYINKGYIWIVERSKTQSQEVTTILQKTIKGEIIKEWGSVREIVDTTKLTGVYNCLKKLSKTAGGFVWEHKNKILKINKGEED